MAEVEIKARVKDKKSLLDRLKKLNCTLSAPVTQIDQVFIPRGQSLLEFDSRTFPTLRIRTQNGKKTFTAKLTRSRELDCIEHETLIENGEEMAKIIKILGYDESVGVTKKRQTGKLDNLNVCLDDVESLGCFIEIEKIIDDSLDISDTESELVAQLDELGIDPSDRVYNGYDILVARSQINP